MKIVLIVCLFISSLLSNFSSQKFITKVEKKHNRFAKNRFLALNKLVQELKNEKEEIKIVKINNFFNKVPYSSDKKIYGVSDYWATPYELLAKDKGDCEDYVIAKFMLLKHLGVASKKMYFTYVRVKGSSEPHMVLSYFKKAKTQPLILDSINKKILPAYKRRDLKPIYNFNPYILKNKKRTAAHKKWDRLIKNFRGE